MRLKILKSKKGLLDEGFFSLYTLAFMFLLVAMAFILSSTASSYSRAFLASDPALPNNIYAYRAINVCLAYQDPVTKRFYPGIVDFKKYNQLIVNKCYLETTLTSFNMKIIDLDKDTDYDLIYAGHGASLSQKSYPITIRYEDGSISRGMLYFGVSE